MLILSFIAALLSSSQAVDPLTLDRTTAFATVVVLVEPHEGEPQTIALAKRWHRDRETLTWTAAVSRSRPGEDADWSRLSQAECPGIVADVDALAGIDTGPFVTVRPDLRPPTAIIGPLYTIWARGRQTDGGSQETRIITQTGPLAAWAEDLRRTVDECLSASAQ